MKIMPLFGQGQWREHKGIFTPCED